MTFNTGFLQTSQPKYIATWARYSLHSKQVKDNVSFSTAYTSLVIKIQVSLIELSQFYRLEKWDADSVIALKLSTVFCGTISLGTCDTRPLVIHSVLDHGLQQVFHRMCVSRSWSSFCFPSLNAAHQWLSQYMPFILIHVKDGKWSVYLTLSPAEECLVMTGSGKIWVGA